MEQKIGLSVSFCIHEIASGKMDINNVRFISAGTRARTMADWESVISDYKKSYWRDFPEVAEQIILTLISEGRIIQPRLEGLEPLPIHAGIWLTVEEYNFAINTQRQNVRL